MDKHWSISSTSPDTFIYFLSAVLFHLTEAIMYFMHFFNVFGLSHINQVSHCAVFL